MNYNAPGAQFRGIVAAITSSQLVVIDNRVPSVFIPNLDVELSEGNKCWFDQKDTLKNKCELLSDSCDAFPHNIIP